MYRPPAFLTLFMVELMPDSHQHILPHKELVTLMLKHFGIHEGRWWLILNFGLGPGNYGPKPDAVNPGIIVAINQIGIQRETRDTPAPEGLVVDAAKVNPRDRVVAALQFNPRDRVVNALQFNPKDKVVDVAPVIPKDKVITKTAGAKKKQAGKRKSR